MTYGANHTSSDSVLDTNPFKIIIFATPLAECKEDDTTDGPAGSFTDREAEVQKGLHMKEHITVSTKFYLRVKLATSLALETTLRGKLFPFKKQY